MASRRWRAELSVQGGRMSRILVIDDSVSVLELIEMLLTEAGHEVVACMDGKRAISKLRSEPFDLLVTDIYMPEMDGLEIIMEGRRIRPSLPVVAMSGASGHRGMLDVARYLGACQTLQKPFSRADLMDAVTAAVGMAFSGGAGRKEGVDDRKPTR